HAIGLVTEGTSSYLEHRDLAPHSKSFGQSLRDPTLTLAPSVGKLILEGQRSTGAGERGMDDEIPINNEGAADSSNSQPTPEKEIDQRNQTIQQIEAALRELLERQTPEAAIASEDVKRAEELAKKQQAILDESEKREKDRLEKLNSKT
ncbi:hypothetical protein PIB30_096003, partial [Stylosanthes scabra]|nr:hypothetical protein [Stylosanthes scabra]